MKTCLSTAIVVAVVLLASSGCDRAKVVAEPTPAPAAVAIVEPGGVKKITLREIEARRLGIAFAEVTKTDDRLTMSYSALLYDPTGKEWAFASPEPNIFVRTPVKVAAIEGDKVFLAEGPPVGTKLVTAGAAELYGIEFGIGK